MGLRDEAIQDGIGHGGFVDVLMPFADGELAHDDGGGAFVAVFQDLEQQEFDGVGDGLEAEVVEDEQAGFFESVEPLDNDLRCGTLHPQRRTALATAIGSQKRFMLK